MSCVNFLGFMVSVAVCFRGNEAQMTTSQLEQELNVLKSQMAQMQTTIQNLQTQLNATGDLAALAHSQSHNEPIAFTATLTTTIPDLAPHLHIAFDRVVTNVGGTYNKQNGHFTAPVFGLYSFTVDATNTPSHSVSLTLTKNGIPQVLTLAHGSPQTPTQWETSSMTTTLLLNEGDQVWVQNEGQFSAPESLDGYNYSSFSGFLFHRL